MAHSEMRVCASLILKLKKKHPSSTLSSKDGEASTPRDSGEIIRQLSGQVSTSGPMGCGPRRTDEGEEGHNP